MTKKKRPTVFLVAGGTGGHITPACVSATYFEGWSVVLVTDPRGERFLDLQKKSTVPFVVLRAMKPWRGWRCAVPWAWSVVCQCIQSFVWVIKNRPSLVVGFGGYPSLSMGLAAFLCRVPLWIHEQNAILGRSNRLLRYMSQRVFLTFQNTGHADGSDRKFVVTGMPTSDHEEAIDSKDFNTFTLLILGGSQGARIFGQLLPSALLALPVSLRHNMVLIQQALEEQIPSLREQSPQWKLKHYEVQSFLTPSQSVMARADAMMSRAGSGTLSEWCARQNGMGQPALLVPYPYAKDQHQHANAQALCEGSDGVFSMCDEKDLTSEYLALWIRKCFEAQGRSYAYPLSWPRPHTVRERWQQEIK